MHVVPAPGAPAGGAWVVRGYRRGGVMARLAADRYFRIGVPRPFREYELARVLESAGIPTPRVVGAAVYPAGPWYRGEIVTEYVRHSADLAAILFPELHGARRPDATDLDPYVAMTTVGRLVRRLHGHGLVHPDLNLKNFIVTADGPERAYVLDLDRARLRPPLRTGARTRMLRRFRRSLRKWEAHAGRPVGAAVEQAFEKGYERGDEAV